MKIWTIRTDDNSGDALKIFTNEDEADAAVLAWCKAHWFHDDPCPEDWQEAHPRIADCEDFMWYEEHEIDISTEVSAIISSARAQIGELIEEISQMKGMFDDADGRTQQAIEDAEAWPPADLTAKSIGGRVHA